MSEWQPIETAPNGRLLLLWMEGWEHHSDLRWRRFGFALGALHDGEISKHYLAVATDQIVGPPEFRHDCFLKPTHWMPLPEPPEAI